MTSLLCRVRSREGEITPHEGCGSFCGCGRVGEQGWVAGGVAKGFGGVKALGHGVGGGSSWGGQASDSGVRHPKPQAAAGEGGTGELLSLGCRFHGTPGDGLGHPMPAALCPSAGRCCPAQAERGGGLPAGGIK